MSDTHDAARAASRRDFLRASATAVGAALTLPLGAMAAGCATQSAATSGSTSANATAAGASMAAGATTSTGATAAAPGARVPGIQLYTVRAPMAQNVETTLTAIAGMGYKEVEFAGYFGREPAAIRRTLDGLGLTAPSAHIPLETLRTGLGPALDAAATIGHQYIVCPFILPNERNADGFRRIADDLARIGAEVKGRGMQLAYHNHDFEFAALPDGKLPYDMLLAIDPSLLKMELDLYWITFAGRDPMAYISANPERFPLAHVKDLSRTGGTPHMADVGQGSIDFRGIFSRAQFRHFFVERDDTTDPLGSARTSERALQALLA